MVFAVTTPDIGTRGISAFSVEKGWKGFEVGDHYDKMGMRSSSTAVSYTHLDVYKRQGQR